jgi:8-oxo-dGTP pyrophosphatase MutT (NUDIX family)
MPLSSVQNYIISRLKNADILRYRDMKPADTPNDLFNYHLKALIAKQLVEKLSEGYRLSDQGREYVADIHHTSDQANRLFKINVITIVSRVKNGEIQILTQTRSSQPSYGQVGVMGGTILKGESFLEGAHRKLEQETGLKATFWLFGIERRQLYKSGKLFSDVLFPICYADSVTGELTEKTEFGHNYWAPIETAIVNDSRPFVSIAAIPKVLTALKNGTLDTLPFFCDETVQKN